MNEFSYKLAYPGIVEIRDGIETLRLDMEGTDSKKKEFSMIDIFKHVFLAPLIGFMIAIPLIYLFDYFGFLDNLSFFYSYAVGIVAATVGFLIGKMVEYRAT